MSIRTLLVDDHTMFRQALRVMLELEEGIEVVGELGDGNKIVETVALLRPDVVVMDISMPGMNGIEATRALMAKHPQIKVVALSASNYKQFIIEMMGAGATAYVVKSAAGDQLVYAINSAAKGKTYLCPESATLLVDSTGLGPVGAAKPFESRRLARRETAVLQLLAQGKSSPQIGKLLQIASSTVDVHRRNIMRKLDLHNVAELTKYAILVGIADL